VPNVTRVIEPLAEYWRIPPDILEVARQRGTAAHMATELFDGGDLHEPSVHPVVRPYLEGWKKFRAETDFEILEVESLLYHKGFHYAGRADRIGRLNGELCVIDIKTPVILEPVVSLQLAAYFEAANHQRRAQGLAPLLKRYAVRLTPAGNFSVQEYGEKSDFSVFLSCLQIFNWRAKHNKGDRNGKHQD
jgi:hypothetical protein